LAYFMRLMRKEDIPQVTEIDREAFPTQWPAANYHHELRNRLSYYILACEGEKATEAPKVRAAPEKTTFRPASWLKRMFGRSHPSSDELPPWSREYILGFAGFRFMANEAHLTTLAVREHCRRQGIGEQLLISIIDLAIEMNASFITLEVRASNTTAQYLYRKYGFTQTGMHGGYYRDNNEDAILMSTGRSTSTSFRAHLNQLKQAHSKKWGITTYEIAR
jgi:ribosomal-protein-alanine N-acetyltransferase